RAEHRLQTDPAADQSDADRVERYQTAINVSWAVTGIAVAGAGTLYFGQPADSTRTIAVPPTSDGGRAGGGAGGCRWGASCSCGLNSTLPHHDGAVVADTRDIDILFLIDDSPSMGDKQTNIRNNFSSFIDVLASIEGGLPNVHIGVISPDLGTKGAADAVPGP